MERETTGLIIVAVFVLLYYVVLFPIIMTFKSGFTHDATSLNVDRHSENFKVRLGRRKRKEGYASDSDH